MLLGNLIQNQFAVARNKPFGSALAFELTLAVLLLLVAYAVYARRRGGEELL
jgi:ABC-type spermidine/putrescine transport system permease subunit I